LNFDEIRENKTHNGTYSEERKASGGENLLKKKK
jgi:hypothetical protein